MTTPAKKQYWISPADRDGMVADVTTGSEGDKRLDPSPEQGARTTINRRRFLEAAGFTVSLAALSGCRRADEEAAYPFISQPVGRVPGRTETYASTCAGCSAGCGLLIGAHDGRPLKMEGMPEHPLSRGGLCAVGQALPLSLYDQHRLARPTSHGKQAAWRDVDDAIMAQLAPMTGGDQRVCMVTPTVSSPTLKTTIDRFLAQFPNARHITFDAVSCSAILDAHQRTHGKRVLPHFKIDRAQVIVSFGADFLGTWISPVEFTAAWSTHRAPVASSPHMSHLVQLEGRMSLTGSNADRRIWLAPDEYAATLSVLAHNLALRAGQAAPEGSIATSVLSESQLADIAERLWHAHGESLVLCDSQDVEIQVLVNAINHYLGNYGKTVDITRPSRQRQSNDAEFLEMIDELKTGGVAALFVAGTDLVHNLPDQRMLSEAIGNVPLVVSFAERMDDTASLAHFVCPDLHPLQSWMDAEPVSGIVSLSQPTMRPLGEARSILESLGRWSKRDLSALETVQETWKEQIYPRFEAPSSQTTQTFQKFWDQAVHDGFVELSKDEEVAEDAGKFHPESVGLLGNQPAGQGLSLALYIKVGMPGSQHAHNAWLQELPDPVSKVTWDNYVCVPDALARELKLTDGDVVSLQTGDESRRVELPALVQPGQHPRVLAIALAYGVKGTDRFADIGPPWLEARPTTAQGVCIGKNAAPFIDVRDGLLHYWRGDVTLQKTGRRHDLATTQRYSSLTMPPNVAPRRRSSSSN